MIYNEHKVNLDSKEQDNAIAQIDQIEKALSKDQQKKAVKEAEKLLGHDLVKLSTLHSDVFSIPVK